MRTFVIIDGNAIIHRAYHALPKNLRSRDGQLTNAVYGFTGILLGILEVEDPEYVAVAFDRKGPTFRHAEMTEYKATRKKTDDELISQFPLVRQVLQALSVPIFEKDGLEADDYLGIVSHLLVEEHEDIQILVVTNDQDALQLVSDRITVVAPVSGYSKVKRYDREAVKEKLGVWPKQIPDYKGLRGDSSDNIPGVPGIGPKGAVALLEQFGSLEGIYENLEQVEKERVRELLREHEEGARLSKKVATILTEDGDLGFSLEKCTVHEFDIQVVRGLFEELSFRTPMRRVEALAHEWRKKQENAQQVSLF